LPKGEQRQVSNGPDYGCMTERKGEEKYCQKDLITGVCPSEEERRDIAERRGEE